MPKHHTKCRTHLVVYIYIASEGHLEGYFCSDTVFNISRKALTDSEIRILEKGLDSAPIQNKINEPKLRNNFKEFWHRIRTK